MNVSRLLLTAIGLGALLAAIVISTTPRCGPSEETSVTESELSQLTSALQSYRQEYGRFPSEAANSAILATLCGSNPRRQNFYTPNPKRRTSAGEATDLWGIPLLFENTSSGILVRSAGKDRTFHTHDDIIAEASAFTPSASTASIAAPAPGER